MSSSGKLLRTSQYWRYRFKAMASPCEVLLDVEEEQRARELGEQVMVEAKRIEAKFSRYRNDNIIYRINRSQGQPLQLDQETAELIDYAQLCFQLSQGKFDITSGILRRAWTFDGGAQLPAQTQIDQLIPHVGFQKLRWKSPWLQMEAGMELDLGGVGKEYAVDRCALLLKHQGVESALVNFGGDLHATGPRTNGDAWEVAIENPTGKHSSQGLYSLYQGAMATSGDSHRYLLKDGVRYSHVLNPLTGWPVVDAPRSVTVLAPTCLQAGMLASFAMLQGANAETFLQQEQAEYRLLR